jgi:D-beta-D-heptose 7-phosphate kinase/D-beta-D-heptose 1-phosphate adenosyltransferase
MRVMASNQQVVRVDTEHKSPLCAELAEALQAQLCAAIENKQIDALLIEDYAKGTLSEAWVRKVMDVANAYGLPVGLDPHPANAMTLEGLTLMTPNRPEAFALAGQYFTENLGPVDQDDDLMAVAKRLLETWGVHNLLVTLGMGGICLFQEGEPPLHIPTQAREVYDVSGAGDTVISSFLLSLLAGASPEEAAIISTHAAAVVVGKVGTAPVNTDELLDNFRAEHDA